MESQTYKGFYLRDRFGSLVLIRTAKALPDIQTEIVVRGIALKDADTGDIFITEESRDIIPSADKVKAEDAQRAAQDADKARRDAVTRERKAREDAEKD